MKSLIIFDLDGTLLNTIEDLGNSVNYALAQMEYPTHAMAAYPAMVGNGVMRLVERALPSEVRTPAIVERMLEHFRQHYDQHCTDCTVPYPGIPELIADLTDRGINLAVTSNKYQEAVTKLIMHFSLMRIGKQCSEIRRECRVNPTRLLCSRHSLNVRHPKPKCCM